ncbi:MAG: hypothetical protein ACE5KM_03085 [Planctomycetaceae bacterium]
MNTDPIPRPAYSGMRPVEAPDVAATTPSGRLGLSEAEAVVVQGLRLLQRVQSGGTLTALDRAVLTAMSPLLEQLGSDCRTALERFGDSSKTGKTSAGSSRRKSSKKAAPDGSALQ